MQVKFPGVEFLETKPAKEDYQLLLRTMGNITTPL